MMRKGYFAAAIILSVSLFALLPGDTSEAAVYASPFGDYGYVTHGTGSAGDPYWCSITSFESSDKYVTVQPALEGYPMTEISAGAFGYCGGMTDLILPATLERIGADAFSQCGTLERIYFLGDRPDTADGSIPDGTEIYHLTGTKGWGAETKILPLHTYSGGNFAFGYYVMDDKAVVHSLISGKDIVIPSSVTAGGKTAEVKTIGDGAFRESDITSVKIADSVEVIGVRAFYYCQDLEDAVLPSSLKIVSDEAFRMCAVMGNVDLHNAEYIGFEAFRMCYSFTEVVIPDSVTVMREGAFRVCTQVMSLTIGSGISEIPDFAFDYYWSLEKAEIRGKVTSVGNSAFANLPNRMPRLESISLPYAETIGDSAFAYCTELKEVITGDSLKKIGSRAFYECRSLQTVHLPASLEKVGNSAFSGTRELTDVYFAGSMPEIGDDVFLNSGAAVHCKRSHEDSWSGYGGYLVVDPDESAGPVPLIAAAAVLICLSAAALFLLRSKFKKHM